MPYVFIALTMIPIFIVAFLFPAQADNYPFTSIDIFIKDHLLGVTGFWSSRLPFSSIVITNYVAILGPVFSIIFFCRVYKAMLVDPNQYKNMNIAKYLFCLVIFVFFICMIVSVSYFNPHDLAAHSRKWRIFGANPLAFSIFSSGVLFINYFISLIVYFSLFYIPKLLFFAKK